MTGRWLGIDFSGDAEMWRARRRSSNIWIADIRQQADQFVLNSLAPIQELAAEAQSPFDWLAEQLSSGDYWAAAIDAPFSVPEQFVPGGSHSRLLEYVGGAPLPPGRPFLSGMDFVQRVTGQERLFPPKPLRRTEQIWERQRVNVRSTLWSGPRGGAQMTAACVRLLYLSQRPIWPWSERHQPGLLVEAFPAAQLKAWGLPYQQYGDKSRTAIGLRKRIIEELRKRVEFAEVLAQRMQESPDALDAVLSGFAGIAATTGTLAHNPEPQAQSEGWIAIDGRTGVRMQQQMFLGE